MNNYCSWVFPILKKVENKINVEEYPRVFGLITEAIFNVWIDYNDLKVKEHGIYYYGTDLRFRMFFVNNRILRKGYQFLYFNLFRKSKGKSIERRIHEIFYG